MYLPRRLPAVVLRNLRPVNDVPPSFDVIRAAVLVIQVVGVFPDVHTNDRFVAVHQWTVLVRRGHDFQFSVFVFDQPCPAATKATGAGGGELFLQGAKAAEGRLNVVGQLPARLTSRIWSHDLPEE